MPTPTPDPVLHGVGVIIDNCIKPEDRDKDLIGNLLQQIKDARIPHVLYDSLPHEEERKHLCNVAFILLDWELWEKPKEEDLLKGVTLGDEREREGIYENIEFLKELKSICFAPVFIFSHLDPERIRSELKNAGLLPEEESPAFILVKSKHDLKRDDDHPENRLVAAVNKWTEQTPSIYLLSRWREALARSQNSLFWDLYEEDMAWPTVLWEAYAAENDDPEHGLTDILHRNMRARMAPLKLQQENVAPEELAVKDKKSIRTVLEIAMIVPDKSLHAGQYGTGDLYKGSKHRYRLNIRCDCDCIPRDGDQGLQEPILYLLKGKKAKESLLQEYYDEKHGLVQKRNVSHLLFPVGSKPVRFEFHELIQATPTELKSDGFIRVGRVTPPHITQVRQRYALYLQREGLPRIPDVVVATCNKPVPTVPDDAVTKPDAGEADSSSRSQARSISRTGMWLKRILGKL